MGFNGLVDLASLKAFACNEALNLAADLHLSSECVASILREISYRRGSFEALHFIQEKRTHNGEAHALVKAASSLPHGAICGFLVCPILFASL